MFPMMTASAECDEVSLVVTSLMAPKCEVMDLEVLHASARLTSPVVAVEDLPVQNDVVLAVKL
jgi:hypothetical protein